MDFCTVSIKRTKLEQAVVFKLKWVIIFILVLVVGCFAPVKKEFPAFETKRCVEYQSCQSYNDFNLAIQPIQEKELVTRYFGTDLTANGIIPVFIVAENNNKSSTYMLLLDQISSAMTVSETKKESYVRSTNAGLAKAIFAPVGVPLYFSNLSNISSSVKHNITIKSIRKETLSPGGTQSGFIYLSLPEWKNNNNRFKINIKVINTKSKEVHGFSFMIDL